MGNDTIYTNTIVRKKARENDVTSCAVTSGHVTSVHVTSISQTTSGHAQLHISFYCYGKKKARESHSGHVQNILPVMTSLRVTWRHIRSGPLPMTSLPVTHTQWHAPLCSPWNIPWAAPQAHRRVSNINFDIWKTNYGRGVSINIPCKIY